MYGVQISAAVVNTRGNDSGPLKRAILGYVHADMHPINPPLCRRGSLEQGSKGL